MILSCALGSRSQDLWIRRRSRHRIVVEHMHAEHLYSENWLLAYEALVKGWLPSVDGSSYVSADPFFNTLAENGVEFYDTATREPAANLDG